MKIVKTAGTIKPEFQAILDKFEQRKQAAKKRPNQLIRLAPGSYLFYHLESKDWFTVEDNSREVGGQPDWVVRHERTHNVCNTYHTLRDMKEEWL